MAEDKTFPDDEEEAEESTERGNGANTTNVGEAGVALLQSWMAGNVPKVDISDPGWTFTASQIGNYAFYIPTNWRYFEQSDPTPANFNDGFVTTTTIASPDDDAFFYVHDVALLPFVLTMEDFLQDLIGGMASGEEVDVIVEQYYSLIAPNDGSFAAARIAGNIVTLQTYGTYLNTPGFVSSSYSVTIQVGKAEMFDDLARFIFLPMLSNFHRFSGGSGDSTPTPSPTP